MIEVGCGGSPRIVEGVKALHAEVGRDGLKRSFTHGQILVRDVLEFHLSSSADIKRERPVLTVGLIRIATGFTTVIEEGMDHIGIDGDFDLVPIVGAIAGVGTRDRKRRSSSGGATAATRSAAARATTGSVRVGGRRDTRHAAGVRQSFAGEFLALSVEGDAVERDLFTVERSEDALHALRRLFGAHKDARSASVTAAEGTVESGVLERAIEHQPTTLARDRASSDLAILRFPRGGPERVPASERRTFDYDVGLEGGPTPSNGDSMSRPAANGAATKSMRLRDISTSLLRG